MFFELSSFVLTLTPVISVTPGQMPNHSVGIAETFSWIPIDNNANRPLYARASYITNLRDLSISLSASDISIGGVELTDGEDHNIRATIVELGGNEGNALKILSQDLESSIDDVTIGDKLGRFAAVNSELSALNVFPVVKSGGFTKCATLTSGNPPFLPKQVIFHNQSNDDIKVEITLASGMSCSIPIGKNSSANHIMVLDLAVISVENYSGCELTFLG